MSSTTAWIALIVAGVLETAWAIGLKYANGFTRLWPSVLTVAAMIGSMLLLGYAAKTIPIGTAYAVWVGVGVLGTALIGMSLLDESTSVVRLVSLTFILIGIAGLKVTATAS